MSSCLFWAWLREEGISGRRCSEAFNLTVYILQLVLIVLALLPLYSLFLEMHPCESTSRKP